MKPELRPTVVRLEDVAVPHRGPKALPKKCGAWLEPMVQRPTSRRGWGGRFH